jgi:hypothetical protein
MAFVMHVVVKLQYLEELSVTISLGQRCHASPSHGYTEPHSITVWSHLGDFQGE